MNVNFATSPTETQSVSPSADNAPSSTNLNPNLNPRSCTLCRKRKVRCDRREPCGNCSKASAQCAFPAPGRAKRTSKKPDTAEIQAKLQRLEFLLNKHVRPAGDTDMDQDGGIDVGLSAETNQCGLQHPDVLVDGDISRSHKSATARAQLSNDLSDQAERIGKEFGRLQVDEGRSRYISNKSWTTLSEGFAELRDFLDDPTDGEDDYPSPSNSNSTATTNQTGFLFGFNSCATSLRDFHPAPEEVVVYWNIFKSNVDPVFKVLHMPTSERDVLNAALNLDHLTKAQEVFLFSIYFAAVTSLSEQECLASLGIDKHTALQNYRFATEQAFARCQFFNSQELIVTQALLMFLVCVRRTDDSRYVWMMTGVLTRLALVQGVNRDGTNFNLTPFTTELRRRLWWQIVTLDVRASDDQGCDPTILDQSFDTKYPLNINDEDINPSMRLAPDEREGPTEMTFDLMRYAVTTTVRRLTYVPPGSGACKAKDASLGLREREKIIDDLHQRMQTKYLIGCDTENNPLHWVIATVSKIITARLWLIVHHRSQKNESGDALPSDFKDRFFRTAVEVIQFGRLLETDMRTSRWGWMFKTYTQWHALAVVASELCQRTEGPEVEIAWTSIDSVIEDWDGFMNAPHRGMMFKPLRNLIARARSERAKALQRRAQFPQNGFLGPAAIAGFDPANGLLTGQGQDTTFLQPFDNSFPGVTANARSAPDEGTPLGFAQPVNEQRLPSEELKQNIDNWMFPRGPPPMLEDSFPRGWVDVAADFPSFGANMSIPLDMNDPSAGNLTSDGFTNWY